MNQSVTVQELNDLAARIADLRVKEEAASQAKKAVTTELEAAENKMIETLMANDMKTYKSPVGTLSITARTSVQTPKTPEDRAALFEHLKAQGLYDTMISVNSKTLNSYYKDAFAKAQEQGALDFEIPGIKEVTMTPSLSFRRA